MNSNRKYWPLDDNSEGEIYDNLAWDLPGYRTGRPNSRVKSRRKPSRSGTKSRKGYITSTA